VRDITFLYAGPTDTSFRMGIVRYVTSPGGVPGDYNGNGVVDAGDYVLWRKGGPLQNDSTPGVGPEDYTFWRSRFGATSGAGSGSSVVERAAIPEPSLLSLMIVVASAAIGRRRHRTATL